MTGLTEAEGKWFREECAICLGGGCRKCEAVRDEIDRILADRHAALTARAESAEAAHEAEKAAHERLRAEVEALAKDFDTTVGFRGAATSLRALLGGGEAR